MSKVRTWTVFGLIVWLTAVAVASGGGPGLLAIEQDTGSLYRVSTSDASLQWLGDTGLADVGALEFNPHDGTLYAVTNGASSSLYSLTLGAHAGALDVQLIGDLGVFTFEGGLAFCPCGLAYAMNGGTDIPSLLTIDLSTGDAGVVGSLSERHDIAGLGWRDDGRLVALDSTDDVLMTIDPTNASFAPVSDLMSTAGGVGGMAIADGLGYFVTAGPGSVRPGSNALYSFDLYTGDQLFIGDFDATITGSGFSGLSVIPEPATLILLAVGCIGLLRQVYVRPTRHRRGLRGHAPRARPNSVGHRPRM